MKRTLLASAVLALSAGAWAQTAPAAATAPAPAAKPTQPAVCNNCHKPAPNQVSGYFDNVAFKSQSMQLDLAGSKEIVRFDPATLKVIDAGDPKKVEFLREVKKGHEARVVYSMKGNEKWAESISFKGPIKVPADQLVNYDYVTKLVAQGPEKGNYVLVDSRPLLRFQEGTIPTAINLPYPAFEKNVGLLPADKNKLVVFFCQGVTCMMSPMSLRKAQALGYTNVKVYREGVPEWQMKDYLVTTPQFVKAAYVDKGIPAVFVDARPEINATAGHIIGAVNVPPAAVKGVLKSLPDPKLKAPIVVYDARGGTDAVAVAREFIKAGQSNVQVMNGGLVGWQAAGNPIEAGVPAAKQVAYVPKPRPGSLPADQFSKLARATPSEVLILDVRNTDEANAGMIKGALLIPDEELAARMGEVPKNKQIVTHCATGVRAEMAYHKLKEAGYNAAFLNADIEIDKAGNFKIAPKP
jgi:rhodanese-related sulfurtransferase/plastocyanin